MTPYSISCTTCGARLKVRDERAIGELSLCPKCGSMVMITPPAPGDASSSSGITATAPRGAAPSDSSRQLVIGRRSIGSDFDDAAALLADTVDDAAPTPRPVEPHVRVPARTPSSAAPAAPQAPKGAAAERPRAAHRQAERPKSAATAAQPSVPPAPPPIEPPTESISSIELDPRLSGAGAASSLENAGGNCQEPASGAPSGNPASANAPHAHGEPAAPLVPSPSAGLPAYGEAAWSTLSQQRWRRYAMLAAAVVAAALVVGSVIMFIVPHPQAPSAVAAADGDTGGTKASSPPTEPGSAATPADRAPKNPGEAASDKPPLTADPPAVLPGDPPLHEPPAADPEAPLQPAEEPGESGPAADPPDADTGLGDLAPLVDAFPVPPIDPAPPPAEVEVPEEDDPAAPLPRERPQPLAVDVAARLADKIDGIDSAGAPLAKFIELMTQLSTIPITLDPDALAQVKAGPRTPVSLVRTEPTSIGELLKMVLDEHKLACQVRGEQMVIVPAAIGRTPLLEARHPVEDLAADEEGLRELADHLQALAEPASWEAAGGQGKIEAAAGALLVSNTQAAQFAVHLLLQKLRVARGLAPRSKFDPALFAVESRTARAAPKLSTTVRATFYAPRPLVRIVHHLEQAAGVTILVDWEALLEAGWPPHSEASLVIDGRPLSAALDELLGPMDLAWRAIDAETLQVTSKAALASRPELEFYAIGPLLDKGRTLEQIVAGIETELGRDAFVKHGGVFQMRYDAPSRTLLARLPQAQQRSVETLLARWQAE